MGFLDPFTDGLTIGPGGMSRPAAHRRHSSRSHHKKNRSRSRSRSSSRDRGRSFAKSFFGVGNNSSYHKHNTSRGSFFGLGKNDSRSSFFGLNRSSYYKRSPRHGFVHRTVKSIKRKLRDLMHYAKRHPWKVLLLVIVPLITTGALTALLARFGLRLPSSVERLLGTAARAASGDHIGLVGDAMRMAGDFSGGGGGARGVKVERGRDGGMAWERKTGYSRNDGWGDGFANVAKMFS